MSILKYVYESANTYVDRTDISEKLQILSMTTKVQEDITANIGNRTFLSVVHGNNGNNLRLKDSVSGSPMDVVLLTGGMYLTSKSISFIEQGIDDFLDYSVSSSLYGFQGGASFITLYFDSNGEFVTSIPIFLGDNLNAWMGNGHDIVGSKIFDSASQVIMDSDNTSSLVLCIGGVGFDLNVISSGDSSSVADLFYQKILQ